jgi:diaminopimelate decarboxylase
MDGSATKLAGRATEQPDASRLEALVRQAPEQFSTPCYIFDPATVVDQYQALRDTLQTNLILSLKANPCPDLLTRCFHAFVDGVEVASPNELAIIIGRSKLARFVNNPSMDLDFVRSALAARATIIVDNLRQADLVAAQMSQAKPLPVILRLNAGGLSPDHFGMDLLEAAEAADRLHAAKITIAGCHSFAGSHSFGPHSLAHALSLADAAATLEARVGYRFAMLNLGGGFAPNWNDAEDKLRSYAARLEPLRARYTLFHESGRGIFGKAGVFVTRIVAGKVLNGHPVMICDGGMAQNFLLSQTENVLRNLATPVVIAADGGERPAAPAPIRFAGATCNKKDLIGQLPAGAPLPQIGDLCVFKDCGAYNATYTVDRFLGSKPAQIYVNAYDPGEA